MPPYGAPSAQCALLLAGLAASLWIRRPTAPLCPIVFVCQVFALLWVLGDVWAMWPLLSGPESLSFDNGSSMNLLYVEDDPDARQFVCGSLEKNGLSIDAAEDGRTGFALATDRAYDLLLLDVGLPDESGFELLRRIRDRGIDSPVIFLTAQGEVARRVEGLELGADDYVSKPFALAELLARIRAVLRRRNRSPGGEVLRVADLELDPFTRTVTRSGRVISLTPKEFALLEFLLESRGDAVSRSMIIEKIWGFGFVAHDNVIDVHMNRLRSKIDHGFDTSLIRTIRGVGYAIERPIGSNP